MDVDVAHPTHAPGCGFSEFSSEVNISFLTLYSDYFGISHSALNSIYSLIISEPGTEMLIQLNILTGHNYTAPTGVSGQWNQCKYP